MDYYCKQCKETGEAEISVEFLNGDETTWEHCSNCGSDNIIRVDDMFDAESYAKEDR